MADHRNSDQIRRMSVRSKQSSGADSSDYERNLLSKGVSGTLGKLLNTLKKGKSQPIRSTSQQKPPAGRYDPVQHRGSIKKNIAPEGSPTSTFSKVIEPEAFTSDETLAMRSSSFSIAEAETPGSPYCGIEIRINDSIEEVAAVAAGMCNQTFLQPVDKKCGISRTLNSQDSVDHDTIHATNHRGSNEELGHMLTSSSSIESNVFIKPVTLIRRDAMKKKESVVITGIHKIGKSRRSSSQSSFSIGSRVSIAWNETMKVSSHRRARDPIRSFDDDGLVPIATQPTTGEILDKQSSLTSWRTVFIQSREQLSTRSASMKSVKTATNLPRIFRKQVSTTEIETLPASGIDLQKIGAKNLKLKIVPVNHKPLSQK
ncbi:hypothetical protein BC830DRAFT_1200197 [Chytriomyces sp. MP71]|nr:hypothetical protein BC830DRAFT_1200197 [Chytriomyces sp. MP71]